MPPASKVIVEKTRAPVRFLVSEPGNPRIPALAQDMDLRTDVGEYRIFRDGRAIGTATNISELWQSDFIAFVLGCSFSFEQELMKARVRLRHITEGSVSQCTSPTSIPQPRGNLVAN